MNKQEQKEFQTLKDNVCLLVKKFRALDWKIDNPQKFHVGNMIEYKDFDCDISSGIISKVDYCDYNFNLLGYWLYTIIHANGKIIQEIEKALTLKQ